MSNPSRMNEKKIIAGEKEIESSQQQESHTPVKGPLLDNLKLSSIINTLSELGIKRILIADDSPANLAMAKHCFDQLPLEITYCTSAQDAIQKIQSSYPDNKYDLVLTDLEMEEEESGKAVAREGYAHQADSFIVTGRDYDSKDLHHGPATHVLGLSSTIQAAKGKKDEPGVREELLEKIANHLSGDGRNMHDALKRYYTYVKKPGYEVIDTLMQGL